MKEIDRPDWLMSDPKGLELTDYQRFCLDNWFENNVEPVNEAIRNGVEVYGCYDPKLEDKYAFTYCPDDCDTHKALLIDIQPIKPKSREAQLEEVLREIVRRFHPDDYSGIDTVVFEMYEKARKLLDSK